MTTHSNKSMHGACQQVHSDISAPFSDAPIRHLAHEAMAKVLAETRKMVARQGALGHVPSPGPIRLAQALVETDQTRADAMIADLLQSGVGVRDLCLDHLVPAARELGTSWECDELQFADVTLAAARIQSILRTMPMTRARVANSARHRALFAAVPGETHTLGVIMAADHFRRLGWDVGLLIGMEHAEMCRRIRDDDRTMIGLSCAGLHAVPALGKLVDQIRQVRPDMGIVVSGNIVTDQASMATLQDINGVVETLETAEDVFLSVADITRTARRVLAAG